MRRGTLGGSKGLGRVLVGKRHLARIGLASAVLLTAACTAPDRTEAGAWHRFELGLCEDYPEETRSLTSARADLQLAHDTGAAALRIAFGWDAMEPEPGQYDWSFWDAYVRLATEQYHIRLIPYVCYTPRWATADQGPDYWRSPPRNPEDFGRFVTVLVQRYRKWIHSWELWNEPDNQAYWLGTPGQFAALVRAGSRAVRQSDPRASIVLGGLAGKLDYLETLFRDEHLAPAVDIVNFHSYFETWHPDPIEKLPREVARAAQIVDTYGQREPLWMAETGYSTVGPRPETSGVYRPWYDDEHTSDAQANALVRTIVLAAGTARLSELAWYRINDLPPTNEVIGDDNNRHLGLLALDRRPKPAVEFFTRLAALFRQPYRPVGVRLEAADASAPEAEVRAFEFADGRYALFAWLPMPGSAQPGQKITRDNRSRRIALRLRSEGQRIARVSGLFSRITQDVALWQKGSDVRLSVQLTGSRVTALELQAR